MYPKLCNNRIVKHWIVMNSSKTYKKQKKVTWPQFLFLIQASMFEKGVVAQNKMENIKDFTLVLFMT